MEYYKDLYETSRTSEMQSAGKMGRAQGNLLVADSILSTMDAYMDPNHFQDKIDRVREHIKKAEEALNLFQDV